MLDPKAADRLAKLAGLLGSDHAGERANAAALCTALLREHNITWAKLVEAAVMRLPARAPDRHDTSIAAMLARWRDRLSAWEREFLIDVATRTRLSPRQRAALSRIQNKAAAWEADAC